MELFTAILLFCWTENEIPMCIHSAWPKLLTSEQDCLDTLANGIKAVELRGGKVVGYRCIDWNGGEADIPL